MMGGSKLVSHTMLMQEWTHCSCVSSFELITMMCEHYTMQRPFFHFHTLGYRQNPFGALTDEEWVSVAILPPAAVQALSAGFDHLQLLGPMGAGKSSTLLALQAALVREGWRTAYEYLPLGKSAFDTETAVLDAFLLDEAQRLSWRQRRKLLKGAENGRLRLILSSHEDLTRLFARQRLRLTSIDLAGGVDVAWITAVLAKRLDYFALPGQPRAVLTDDALLYLHQHFQENLRQMEYFLYEVWQNLSGPDQVTRQTLIEIHSQTG